MSIKRVIGWSLILSPVIGMFVAGAIMVSLKAALCVFAGFMGVCFLVGTGAMLLNNTEPPDEA